MRAIAIGVLAAMASSVSAQAEPDLDNGIHWIIPKSEDLRAQWPKGPDGFPIYGKIWLECGSNTEGYAADCSVKSTEPADPSLAQAAPALARLFKARDKAQAPQPLELSVMFDTRPDWLHKPSPYDLYLAWPRGPAVEGKGGWAVVKCTVNTQGLTQDCSVVKESKPPLGFGAAALKLTPTFLFKPATRRGQPVDGEVSIPINFPTDTTIPVHNKVMLPAPAWAKTPTAQQILGQLDKKIGDKFANGKIVFMCNLDKHTGKVSHCILANESTGMTEFRGVAWSLTDSFEADPKAMADIRAQLDPKHIDALVFLPFSFPDMTSPVWNGRHLTHTQWARLLSPGPGRPLFPDAAVKAGLKTGSASVDCLVADDGGLSDCKVIKESAPNVGFGDMAKTIAEGSAISPWTDEGLPAGGARVQLPIHMAYDDKAAAAAAGFQP